MLEEDFAGDDKNISNFAYVQTNPVAIDNFE